MDAVDRYLARFDGERLETLLYLRGQLANVLPGATERMSYGIPTMQVHGKSVAGYGGFASHCSYFPHSSGVIGRVGTLPPWCEVSAGTIRFPYARRLPMTLVRRLVRARLDEFADVRTGRRLEFYDDGSLKAEGAMRAGELHGPWSWYRRDGSLMRRGRFSAGRQVGAWETWDADGRLVRTTDHGR